MFRPPVPLYGGVLPVRQSLSLRIRQRLPLVPQPGPGEGRPVPLAPAARPGRPVAAGRRPHVGGEQEPALLLPVPHNVEVPDTRPGGYSRLAAHCEDPPPPRPGGAPVLAAG